MKNLRAYISLMRLDKPIGIFLLLWPTLIALWWAASGHPDPFIVGIFVLGVACMRSAGCVINDFADRQFDGFISRTKGRPLVTGKIKPKEALILLGSLLLLAFILVMQLNFLTLKWSIAALSLAMLYPFVKRFSHLPQIILGAAFAMSIPMAFAALTNHVPAYAFLLYGGVVLWVIAYDTEYAMVDREEDKQIGIKSTAILFGKFDKLIILLLQSTFLYILIKLGLELGFGFYYYSGIAIASLLILYQQWLIKGNDPKKCLTAFLNNNYVGGIIFLGLYLDLGSLGMM